MSQFKVTMKLRPMVRQALGSSVAARLPDSLRLGELEIVRQGDEECHATIVSVRADSGEEAMEVAIGLLRTALFVLATLGHAYEIEYWPMPRVEAVAAPPRITRTGDGVCVALDEIAAMTGHVSVVVTRADYSKQAAAVAASSAWPTWLRVALELNYMAVTAREDRSALVSYWSSLEVIVNGTQGTPKALAKTLFGRQGADDLRDRMVSWSREQGLAEVHASRLAEQAENAHAEGTLDRTRRCLQELGVDVDIGSLKSVSGARGSILHAQSQPTADDVRQALEILRGWLRKALQALLDRYV